MDAGSVRSVGVVGCGLMGAGIVETVARAGMDVRFVEADADRVAAGTERIAASLDRAVARGRLASEERDAAMARIAGVTDLADLAGVDLVIEAATEDPAVKRDVFARLDGIVAADVVLASTTSSIPIADLAAATGRPDRVAGMHFFNPVPAMALLELVRAPSTSDATLRFCRGVGERLGKTCVVSRDRAGFIVNALLIPFLLDAIRMLELDFASREDIDTAVQLGLNHPMGPLRLADLIGLDTVCSIAEVLHAELGEERYTPPPLLRRMVADGRLGAKVGRGFYDHP